MVPDGDQVKFDGVGWNKRLRRAEKKFVRDAGCPLWRIVRSLSPIHPEADDYAHGGHQEIFFEGAVNASRSKYNTHFSFILSLLPSTMIRGYQDYGSCKVMRFKTLCKHQ